MKRRIIKSTQLLALIALCASASGCDDMRVYGSVGVSSYSGGGGYWGGGTGVGTSVTVGGRIR